MLVHEFQLLHNTTGIVINLGLIIIKIYNRYDSQDGSIINQINEDKHLVARNRQSMYMHNRLLLGLM